jgi:hypothetical protein
VNINARKRVSHGPIVTLCVEDATRFWVGDSCPPSTGVTTPALSWRNGSAVAEGCFRFQSGCVRAATRSGVGFCWPSRTGVMTPVLRWRNGSAVAVATHECSCKGVRLLGFALAR